MNIRANLWKYMKRGNLTVAGLLKYQESKMPKVLNMSHDAYSRYKNYYEKLKKDIDEYKRNKKHILTSKERGKVLEQIAACLFFSGMSLFEVALNCRTSTNEIDLLVNWSDSAVLLGIDRLYEYMGRNFLCECKNYEGGVGVTYVGKFYSLVKVNKCKFGLMVTTSKLKGRGKWDSSKGLIKKLALSEGIYIIDINWDDLTRIYKKETCILKIIKDKYISLTNEISYEQFIQKHEFEDQFLQKLK